MQITVKNILTMIAKDATSAAKYIADFESLGSDERFLAERAIWDAYDALYDARLEANFQLAMEDVKNGKEVLDEEFYKKVREKTEKELTSKIHSVGSDADLVAVREKLQQAMSVGVAS